VVLGATAVDGLPSGLAEVRATVPVLHETGRVLTCSCGRDEAAVLARRGDVIGVYRDVVPDEVRRQLGQGEDLFVQAWEQRRSTAQAPPDRAGGRGAGRRGEGASWGSDEFEPPDLLS